jgi:hypothetical protein
MDGTGEHPFTMFDQCLIRSNITCSPSYVGYRPKANAVILLDTGHTLGGEHAREG